MRLMKLFAIVGLPVVTAIGAGSVISVAAKAPASPATVRTAALVQAPAQTGSVRLAAAAPATALPQAEPAGTEAETPAAAEAPSAGDSAGDAAGGHNDTSANADHQFDGNE